MMFRLYDIEIAFLEFANMIDPLYFLVFMYFFLACCLCYRLVTFLGLAYEIAQFEKTVSDRVAAGYYMNPEFVQEWLDHMLRVVNYRYLTFIPLLPFSVRIKISNDLNDSRIREYDQYKKILILIRELRINLHHNTWYEFVPISWLKALEQRMRCKSMRSKEANRKYTMKLLLRLKFQVRCMHEDMRNSNIDLLEIELISESYNYIYQRCRYDMLDTELLALIDRDMQARGFCDRN
jgi:hypothetical protein